MIHASFRNRVTLLFVFVVWAGLTWYAENRSKQELHRVIQEINASELGKHIQITVDSYRYGLYGSESELKLTNLSGLLPEAIDSGRWILKRHNGPVFLSSSSVTFGLVKWQLYNETERLVTLVNRTTTQSQLTLSKVDWRHGEWLMDAVDVVALFNEQDSDPVISIEVSGLKYASEHTSLHLGTLSFSSERLPDNQSKVADVRSTIWRLLITQGVLSNRQHSKNIAFNLQGDGSLWANNDTLSGDVRFNASSGVSGDLNLQFRALSSKGIWETIDVFSRISLLAQETAWAIEEVETPEQQDFLISLLAESDGLKQGLVENLLKPLLLHKRSQLALNANLVDIPGYPSVKLNLGGGADGNLENPDLKLQGQISIGRAGLNRAWQTMLTDMTDKKWLRQYEAEFESDVELIQQQMRLNDNIVSRDRLLAELSRFREDQ